MTKIKSPLKHTDGGKGHLIMTKEAHINAHGGDAVAAGYEEVEKSEEPVIPFARKEKEKNLFGDFTNLPILNKPKSTKYEKTTKTNKVKTNVKSIKKNPKVEVYDILGNIVEPNENGEFGDDIAAGNYFLKGKNGLEKILYNGSDTSVFKGAQSEIKEWRENPLWVESKMKPFKVAKNTDGSPVYNEEQLNIIQEHLEKEGENPFEYEFGEDPKVSFDKFLRVTLEQVTGKDIPDNFDLDNFGESYNLSDIVDLDKEEFDWENIFLDGDIRKVGSIDKDPNSVGYGYRIKKGVQDPNEQGEFIATEWHTDTDDYSWEYLNPTMGWKNWATGETALLNSKTQHPYFEGIITAGENPIDYSFNDVKGSSYYSDMPTSNYVLPLSELPVENVSDFEKILTDRVNLGEKYGFNINGTPKGKTEILVGDIDSNGNTKNGYVTYDAIWAGEDGTRKEDFKVPVDKEGGYPTPYEIYSDAVEQSTLDVILDAPFTIMGFDNPTGQVISNNWAGSEDQKSTQISYVQRFGNILQGEHYTQNTQQVTLDDINSIGETYLTSSEHEIRIFLENGEFKKAKTAAEALGYKILYGEDEMAINWEKEEPKDLISDYFRIVNTEVEEEAKEKAATTTVDDLEEQRASYAFQLKAMAKVLNPESTGEIETGEFRYSSGGIGSFLNTKDAILSDGGSVLDNIFGDGAYDKNWNLISAFANGDEAIINGLDYLPEGHPKADAWNTALKNFKRTNRALEINVDLTRQETTVSGSIAEGLDFGEQKRETDEVATAETMFEDMGYTQKKSSAYEDHNFTRYSQKERMIKSTSETALVIAEIAASIYLTKKIPLSATSRINAITGATTVRYKNFGQYINTWKAAGVRNVTRGMGITSPTLTTIASIPIYGAAEVITLAAAEPINQGVFGADPFIFDVETGEIHPQGVAFAFALGALGPAFQVIKKGISKIPGAKQLAFATEEFGMAYKYTFPKVRKTVFGKMGEAATGTAILVGAEILSGQGAVDYNTWKELNYASEEEMREWHGTEHLMNNYLALFAFGAFSPGKRNTLKSTYEAVRSDLANFQGTTRWAQKGSKVLGFEKSPTDKDRYTTETINKKLKEKIAEVEGSKKTNKEKSEEIKKLQKAAKDMHFDNELSVTKEIIKQEDISRNERQVVFDLHLKAKRGETLTGKEMYDFANLTEAQMSYYKSKMGIVAKDYILYEKPVEINSEYSQYLDNLQGQYREIVSLVNKMKLTTDPKARNSTIEKLFELNTLEREYKTLTTGKNKESAVTKQQAKEIKEKIDLKSEEIINIGKKFNKNFDLAAARTKRLVEKLSEDLGKKAVFVEPTNKEKLENETDKQYEERLDREAQEKYEDLGGDKKSSGYHEKGVTYTQDKIIVNMRKAKRVGSIGVGIHEVGHYILRDAYKERYTVIENGKEVTRERISKHGIDVIDKFLETLKPKERKYLDDAINNEYRFKGNFDAMGPKDINGKVEKNKSEYYEEYLGHYLQGVKDGYIKLDRSNKSKMGDFVIPQLQKYGFTNIGKGPKKGGEKYNIDNPEGLKKLLNDIYIAGERGVSKYELSNFMRENPGKTVEAYENFKYEKNLSKFPEMERINKIGEKYTREEWQDGKWREGYEEIIPDLLKLVNKKVSAFDAKAPGLIKDPTTFAWEVIQEIGGITEASLKRKRIGGHVKNFNIEKKTYTEEGKDFGLSGHINAQINNKLYNVLKRASNVKDTRLESLEKEGMKELVDPTVMDIIESTTSNETARRIVAESSKPRIHEVFSEINRVKGEQVKEIHDGIKNEFINKNGGINVDKLKKFTEGKNMKNLSTLALPKVVEFFIKDKALAEKITKKLEKDSNLDGTDIKAIQAGINKFVPVIAEYVIPEGFVTKEVKGIQVPAESTGVPKKILDITHNKRSIAGGTTMKGEKARVKENFFGFYKKNVTPELLANLREGVGIMKDGSRNVNTRKNQPAKGLDGVGEVNKRMLTMTAKMITNQAVREVMSEAGLGFEASILRIADGKPSKSYSKGKDRITSERLLEVINLKLLENPGKTTQLISEIKRSYETLSEAQWEKFKELNDTDFIEIIEREMLAGEGNKASMSYAKLMLKKITETSNFVSDKGRVKSENKLVAEGIDGKYQTAKGDKQSELSVTFRENLHPVFDGLPTWMHNITGHKGPKFDGRTLIRTESVSNVKSKLTKKEIKVMEAKLKEAGIEIDAIKNAVQMVKTNSKVKKVLEIAYSKEGVTEKLDLLKKYEKQIDSWTEGNINLHKAILESQKILHGQKKLPTEYVFNEGRLQTNITAGKRALSTFKFMYLVDGKQVHTKAAPTRGERSLSEYYSSKEYREWIEGWKETTEWQERFSENKNDPKVKEAAEKKEISLDQAIERATIKDLSFGNEHMKSNAETMVEGADYIVNGNGKLDAIARSHNTAWVPNYIREKYLDKFGPKVSEKGDFRLSAYLPTAKLKNVYTHKGESALQYLTQKTNLQQTLKTLAETRLQNSIKAVENIVGKNYSKGKDKKTIKEVTEDIRNISKAVELGRLGKKKRKGGSFWDFDDTLATTKSGVRARIPNADGMPKPNRKVVFLAGGAGSGKGNVIKKLQLEKQGFKIVNSDISLEWLKKNSGLPENMRDLTREQLSELGKLQYESRNISKRKMMKYQGNAEGVVVDGTGGSIKAMEKLVKEFKDKGYDVSMLFVETSLKTALERNRARKERSLLDKIVEKNHEAVQGNKPGFKTMFGERFMEVKTDKLKQEDAMPADLTSKMNDFVVGYEKIRLDAEQFAAEGKSILDKGGKFDFSEFNIVTEGAKGPFFQKALDRAKKFGTKDQFIVTARPAESAGPIHEFLKSQGLNIPLENITGLGNSTGEAKAMYMLKKFAEGYNDMYFADDAMQNVKAVKDALSQVPVISKVVQAKSLEYKNIKQSRGKHRVEYEKIVSKSRPDLVKDGIVSKNVEKMFDLVESMDIPVSKRRKYEQIMTKWLATSKMILPEDGYKLKDAVELAEKHKEDIFSYKNPNEIIEKYAGKAKAKPTDPNTVKEFAKGTVTNKKHGITEHEVADTREGQAAVRKVMDTHFGPKSNPWCLAQRKNGKLTENSWEMWEHYSDGPKSLVFQNGRLIGFKANEQYWDRMDNATDAPVITVKEGRVTKMVELVPIGEGRVQEFVMETRTTSKDKKTVTTEYHVEKSLDPEGYSVYPEGTKVIENKVNGVTTRETIIKPNGKTKKVTNFKDGKVIEARGFMLDGKTTRSINNVASIDVNKHGDRVNHEITEGKTDYWFGEVSMEAKGLKNVPSKHQEWVQGVAKNIYPIGFKTKKGFEVMDIMERVDGKLRVNFDKLRKIDPDVKGLPKEVIKPEGMRALEPVKKVLDQLDIKSEVQVNRQYSRSELSKDFNKIIEEVKGVRAETTYSEGKGRQEGAKKGKWKWWGSSGMEDFSGLVTYAFAGKGKKGEGHKKFFEDNLQKPYNRAYNEMHSVKQVMSNDYTSLRKSMPEVVKQLRDRVGESVYTVENAIRTYLWNKAGYEIPGMSKRDVTLLDNFVKSNEQMVAFAENVSMITKLKEGYAKPKDYWLAETITSDLQKLADTYYRDLSLTEFVENRKEIFGEWKGGKLVGENMNKIEALYGSKHRENMENILWRMENGTNRPYGTDAITQRWMNWINRSGGAIMFFNVKSAALQTISSINYMNGSFNNPLRAAKAFANQPQYWKDFVKIFNSNMLVQRRSGLKLNVEAAELLSALDGKSSKAERALAYLLEKGFLPTKYADSFAIASGGATFYRNRVKDLIKKGMSEAKAEKQAWIDFTELTEATQQSSRPDFISAQQASPIGRPILMFANTPMQMFRRHKRRVQDLVNNRGSRTENLLSAAYYGFAQAAVFSFLANAMFAKDEEDLEKVESGFNEKKDARFYETIIDSYLRGMGTMGAVPAAIKNALLEFKKQNEKDWNADYDEVVYDLLAVSPPIGSKIRKVVSATKEWKYNKEIIPKIGFNIDNPAVSMTANLLSASLNIPADRLLMKINNLRDATNSDYETWQRIALLTGVNRWALGLGKRDAVIEAKEEVKEEKKIITKKKQIIKKEKKKKEKEEKEEKVIKENQKKSKEDGICSAVSKSGSRCKKKAESGGFCTIHVKVEQGAKQVQCKKIKSDKKRCKMMTNATSGYCYYHD